LEIWTVSFADSIPALIGRQIKYETESRIAFGGLHGAEQSLKKGAMLVELKLVRAELFLSDEAINHTHALASIGKSD